MGGGASDRRALQARSARAGYGSCPHAAATAVTSGAAAVRAARGADERGAREARTGGRPASRAARRRGRQGARRRAAPVSAGHGRARTADGRGRRTGADENRRTRTRGARRAARGARCTRGPCTQASGAFLGGPPSAACRRGRLRSGPHARGVARCTVGRTRGCPGPSRERRTRASAGAARQPSAPLVRASSRFIPWAWRPGGPHPTVRVPRSSSVPPSRRRSASPPRSPPTCLLTISRWCPARRWPRMWRAAGGAGSRTSSRRAAPPPTILCTHDPGVRRMVGGGRRGALRS